MYIVNVSDYQYNREILQTGYISPYMDIFTPCNMRDFDVIRNLQIINRNLTSHLCIGDMTFMIKTDHPDMESIYCCSN